MLTAKDRITALEYQLFTQPAGSSSPRGPGGSRRLRRRWPPWMCCAPWPLWLPSGATAGRRSTTGCEITHPGGPPPCGGAGAEGQPVCAQRYGAGRAGRTRWPSSPVPTWRENPPICGRWPLSCCWPRWAPSSRPNRPGSALWTGFSPASAPRDDLACGSVHLYGGDDGGGADFEARHSPEPSDLG